MAPPPTQREAEVIFDDTIEKRIGKLPLFVSQLSMSENVAWMQDCPWQTQTRPCPQEVAPDKEVSSVRRIVSKRGHVSRYSPSTHAKKCLVMEVCLTDAYRGTQLTPAEHEAVAKHHIDDCYLQKVHLSPKQLVL